MNCKISKTHCLALAAASLPLLSSCALKDPHEMRPSGGEKIGLDLPRWEPAAEFLEKMESKDSDLQAQNH